MYNHRGYGKEYLRKIHSVTHDYEQILTSVVFMRADYSAVNNISLI